MDVITVRYSPELDRLIMETKSKILSETPRPITKSEVIRNAIAWYNAGVTSKLMQAVLESEEFSELASLYKKNLAALYTKEKGS